METVKKIKTVGVVGAGTMGSAIAQRFAMDGFRLYLSDRSLEVVERSIAGIKVGLEQAVEKRIFKQEIVDRVMNNIIGSASLSDLSGCDLVIEAVFENFEVKCDLFNKLSEIVSADAIIATNTSSFSVTGLSASVTNPSRFIGLHYFYHAAKNRLVEVIPCDQTSPETLQTIKQFCVKTSKDIIVTKDAFGFAVNRFFVPWLNEAVRIVEERKASIAEVESVAMKVYGIGMGPFALMNATGISIALHAQKTLTIFGHEYAIASLLKQQAAKGSNWSVPEANALQLSREKAKMIADRLLGSTLYICSQILNEKICSPTELNRGARIGLKWKRGPVEMMLDLGNDEVNRIISRFCKLYGINPPNDVMSTLKMEYVTLEVFESRALITISKPEDLNVLNETIIKQLEEKFDEAETMDQVNDIIITGSGKAFVAGADVNFFVTNMKSSNIGTIVSFTTHGHTVFNKIDQSKKRVIAALNGLTLGGGMELALCADIILAFADVRIAFPETGIGIYPGLGGTQRTRDRIGKGLAKYLVLTGKNISATEAVEIGLVDKLITPEDLNAIVNGNVNMPERNKVKCTGKWKAIEHLFEINNYKSIVDGSYSNGGMEKDEVLKLAGVMNLKAPVAMDVAEELIEKFGGTQSELDKLTTVFLTKDALLGLTNLGKPVTYSGE